MWWERKLLRLLVTELLLVVVHSRPATQNIQCGTERTDRHPRVGDEFWRSGHLSKVSRQFDSYSKGQRNPTFNGDWSFGILELVLYEPRDVRSPSHGHNSEPTQLRFDLLVFSALWGGAAFAFALRRFFLVFDGRILLKYGSGVGERRARDEDADSHRERGGCCG